MCVTCVMCVMCVHMCVVLCSCVVVVRLMRGCVGSGSISSVVMMAATAVRVNIRRTCSHIICGHVIVSFLS